MKAKDSFSEHYEPILHGSYDCIDRIVLNAYIQMLLTPGGLRNWYRLLKGSDDGLTTAFLMRLAGRFSRRVQQFCKQRNIPLMYFSTGERKHEHAEALIPADPCFTGIFAIFVSRAPSLIWEVKNFKSGAINIVRKQKTSLVNHYYFHIIDESWGHITIRMCAHPPFSCNVILNGHEWVERHQGVQDLEVVKESNCFVSYNNGEELTQIADTLKTNGQFDQVCNRWIYSCLWFVMDKKQQQATGMSYAYSIYQIEYSRNLLFKRGRQLDNVYQNVIDSTRSRLDVKTVRTMFGKRTRPYNYKSTAPAPEVRIETPQYDLTVFKIHFGRLTVKLYDKGERTLRAEVVVHNAKDLKCKRSIGSFGQIVEKLESIMEGFLSNIEYAHVATISERGLEEISSPTLTGENRLAGIDFTKPRNKLLAVVLLALAMKPGGFTSKDLASEMVNRGYQGYSCRNASYDIRKFRGKAMVLKKPGSIKYEVTQKGIESTAAILCMINHVVPAILSTIDSPWIEQKKDEFTVLDQTLFDIHQNCKKLKTLRHLKLTA